MGTWNLTLDFAADSCGHAATTAPETLTIAQDGSNYSVASGSASISGNVSCSSSECELTLTMTFTANNVVYTQDLSLSLASNGAITGTGSEAWQTCSSTLTVFGTLN